MNLRDAEVYMLGNRVCFQKNDTIFAFEYVDDKLDMSKCILYGKNKHDIHVGIKLEFSSNENGEIDYDNFIAYERGENGEFIEIIKLFEEETSTAMPQEAVPE